MNDPIVSMATKNVVEYSNFLLEVISFKQDNLIHSMYERHLRAILCKSQTALVVGVTNFFLPSIYDVITYQKQDAEVFFPKSQNFGNLRGPKF